MSFVKRVVDHIESHNECKVLAIVGFSGKDALVLYTNHKGEAVSHYACLVQGEVALEHGHYNTDFDQFMTRVNASLLI